MAKFVLVNFNDTDMLDYVDTFDKFEDAHDCILNCLNYWLDGCDLPTVDSVFEYEGEDYFHLAIENRSENVWYIEFGDEYYLEMFILTKVD